MKKRKKISSTLELFDVDAPGFRLEVIHVQDEATEKPPSLPCHSHTQAISVMHEWGECSKGVGWVSCSRTHKKKHTKMCWVVNAHIRLVQRELILHNIFQ